MSGANRTQQVIVRNSSSIELQVSVPGAVPPGTTASKAGGTETGKPNEKSTDNDAAEEAASRKRPLMTKAAVCRLLAELVKSYGSCAALITEHVFESGMSDLVKEDTTALAFLLDELLVSKSADKECSNLIKTLVAALASCNHFPEAQSTLVMEVKGALSRALSLQETIDKHSKIQALAGLICTMIESCPSTQSQQQTLPLYRQLQYNMNNMVKVMLKKGIINDLARVTHSLDLSSPNVTATVNAVLKPLETLSRIVNQPTGLGPGAQRGGSKNITGSGANAANGTDDAENLESANVNLDTDGGGNVGNAGTNTTNSEATRAQGDETCIEPDPEATEHDISTANESIDPNSESQLHTVEEGNDEEFEDMMDQLLERDANAPEMIAEMSSGGLDSTLDDTHHDSQMLTQDESQIEAQQMSQDEEEEDEDDDDHESESSRESHFEGANDENDDGIEVEGEEEEDEDEDDEDEGDEDDDDDQFQELEEAVYRFPLGDNGDDDLDLMIQYPDESNGMAGHNHIDESRMARAIHLPLWSDMMSQGVGGADHAHVGGVSVSNNHVSPNHPLLMGRQATSGVADGPGGSRSTSRGIARQLQRGFRGYLHFGGRNQNAASGPNNLLSFLSGGGPRAQELISRSLRQGTPMLVGFGYAILDSLGNGVSEMDNSVMGSGGRAALSAIPSALKRWNEESCVIDGDSMHNCVTALKPTILEVVEKAREDEVQQRKAKKNKEEEEEEEKLKRKIAEKAKEIVPQTPTESSEATTTTISADAIIAAASSEAETGSAAVTITETGNSEQPPVPSSLPPAPGVGDAIASSTPNDTLVSSQESTSSISSTAARMAEDLAAAISSHLQSRGAAGTAMSSAMHRMTQRNADDQPEEEILSEATARAAIPYGQPLHTELPPPPPPPTLPLPLPLPPGSNETMSIFVNGDSDGVTEPSNNSLPAALAPLSPSPEQSNSVSGLDRDVVMRSENASPQQRSEDQISNNSENTERQTRTREPMTRLYTVAERAPSSQSPASDLSQALSQAVSQAEQINQIARAAATAAAEAATAVSDGNDPGAGPSGTSTGPDYSTILGINVTDLPEGVDPSFLAALPEEMRQEVIDEQRRLQTIRQRAAQNVEAGVSEVDPQFLAALPTNIQEEVLAQQRIEQQRQAAQANPEAPVDPGEFLQTLPESLRQTILADMEESQIASLPADMAAEAHLRRRELEQTQRSSHSSISRAHTMHERFFGHNSSALSSILRNTVNRIGSSYIVHGSGGRGSDAWRHSFGGRGASAGA